MIRIELSDDEAANLHAQHKDHWAAQVDALHAKCRNGRGKLSAAKTTAARKDAESKVSQFRSLAEGHIARAGHDPAAQEWHQDLATGSLVLLDRQQELEGVPNPEVATLTLDDSQADEAVTRYKTGHISVLDAFERQRQGADLKESQADARELMRQHFQALEDVVSAAGYDPRNGYRHNVADGTITVYGELPPA